MARIGQGRPSHGQRRLGLLRPEPGCQGLDGLCQGLELIGVGGALDGLQHVGQRRLGLLGPEPGRQGLDGLRQGLELGSGRWSP